MKGLEKKEVGEVEEQEEEEGRMGEEVGDSHITLVNCSTVKPFYPLCLFLNFLH